MKRYPITNYDQYLKNQVKRSDDKWGIRRFGQFFYEEIKPGLKYLKDIKRICCMGIRDGAEYLFFKEFEEFKDATISGVDINPRVIDVGSNCFCQDFNKLPIDWTDEFDFVYSNSIDHSFNIRKTLREWNRITKPKGYLMIRFSFHDVNKSDIYGFRKDDIDNIIDKKLFNILDTWDYQKGIVVIMEIKKI